MMLKMTISGEDTGTPILLAHGLFGQGRNLGVLARRLSQSRKVAVVDMRNHGDSFHDADHSYDALAEDLADVIASLGGHADLVGHSMGGKAAMALALTRPALVRKLAVLDMAPVAYFHTQSSYVDAMQGMDLSHIDRRSVADSLLAKKVPDPGVRAFLLQSLDLKSSPPSWKLNLEALSNSMADIVGWPDYLNEARFTGSSLFLAGEKSDYVSSSSEPVIHKLFPNARISRIAGAGHWLHADAPEETANVLDSFLNG